MPHTVTSENGLVAAFFTKPIVDRAMPMARKTPLIFPGDAKTVRLRNEFFASLPPEPEDAKITGATRSLHRRLLALNLGPVVRKAASVAPVTMEPVAKSVA